MSGLPRQHMSGLSRQHMSGLSRQHMSGLSRLHMSGLSRQHMSGLSDHFLVMSGSLFVKFGTCWEMLGHTLGMLSDGFGMVSGKSSDEVENLNSQICPGVFFQRRAARDNHF